MKHTRFWITTLFVALLAVGLLLTNGEAQPNTIKQIVPGVWFREGDLFNQGHCNNIIIEMKDYLVVVDANFPSGAKIVLDEAKKLSAKPIKYVFDTHHHGDHAYGNPVFTKAGAITLAYVGVAEEMKRYEPGRWRDTAKERKDVGELNLDTAEPPKQTFDKSPYIIKDETRRLEFNFFGWAHTRGDGFVYLPKEKVLCTGDAVVNGPFNFTGDGNIQNWPNVVRNAQKLDVEHVLPGHGPAGGKEMLDGQLRFFEELVAAVKAERKAGKKMTDLVTLNDKGNPKSTTLHLSDGVKRWVGPFFASQVKDAFEELEQGKPKGDLQKN